MLRAAAIVGLCVFAACVSDPPAAEAPHRDPANAPRPVDGLLDVLARCPTADEMRTHLEAGLTPQELQFRGFDDVTIAECIDHLIAASLDARQRPHGEGVHARLGEWADLFAAAAREASVRRYAGAASCMPPVR